MKHKILPLNSGITPQPFACSAGRSSVLTVNVGDANTAAPGSIHVRVVGSAVSLDPLSDGVFA
jgi:hypothetical protein